VIKSNLTFITNQLIFTILAAKLRSMKYLVAFAAIAALLVTGCTKSAQYPSHVDIMVSHTWYLKDLVIAGKGYNTPCNLSDELTFKKDSTATHTYGILCDTSQPAKLSFDWRIEDNTTVGNYYTASILTTTLYSTRIAGKADSSTILRLYIIKPDTLAMEGIVGAGETYYAIYTSSK